MPSPPRTPAHVSQSVNIPSAEALEQYAAHVPKFYNQHIHQLTICTKRSQPRSGSTQPAPVTHALTDILPHCSQVEQLTLSLAASLAKAVIPCFEELRALTSLSIDHCGDEARYPLYVDLSFLCLTPSAHRTAHLTGASGSLSLLPPLSPISATSRSTVSPARHFMPPTSSVHGLSSPS